jgi:hypothetical protein
MNRQARLTAAIAIAVTVAAVTVTALAVYVPVARSAARDAPATDPPGGTPRPALADGDLFAWVTLASSRADDHVVLRIDPAELLTGQDAHDAAVEAGVIDDDEQLSNDVFIVNPDNATRTVAVDDTATITVQIVPPDGALTTDTVAVDLLYDVFDGATGDNAVYGLLPGEPLPMRLTIDTGTVTAAEHVYLP